MKSDDFEFGLVDISEVPARLKQANTTWRCRFNELPDGKAAVLHYNNRQRAHQIRRLILTAAKYWKMPIKVRLIHAEPVIHDTDGWLVYFWRDGREE